MDNSSGNMPSDWSLAPLQDLCTMVTKGTTPTTLGKPFTDSGINFVKAESILDNHYIDNTKFAYIDEETNQMLKRSIIEKGDIIFTIAGSLGRFSLVDETIIPANTNQALAIIRLKDSSNLNVDFLNEMLHSTLIEEQVNNKKTGVAQTNLSLTDIGNLNIIIPDISKQIEFSDFVKLIDKSKFIIQKWECNVKRYIARNFNLYKI
jgi:type I restriction enzyme S subunit